MTLVTLKHQAVQPLNARALAYAIGAIGKPWRNGDCGPQSFDCYGLVRHFYAEVMGQDLPVVDVDAYRPLAVRHALGAPEHLSRWLLVSEPSGLQLGDVLLLSQARHPGHVGIWLPAHDEGAVSVTEGVLHCVQGAGVVYQSLVSMRMHGWSVAGIYRLPVLSASPSGEAWANHSGEVAA
jgi:cell wall-associated NlpC family hydrolase